MIIRGDQNARLAVVESIPLKKVEGLNWPAKPPVTAGPILSLTEKAPCECVNFIPTVTQSRRKKNGAYTKNVSELQGVDE